MTFMTGVQEHIPGVCACVRACVCGVSYFMIRYVNISAVLFFFAC